MTADESGARSAQDARGLGELTHQSEHVVVVDDYRQADVVSVYDVPEHEQLARMMLALDWYERTASDLAERAGLTGRGQAIGGLLRRLHGAGLAGHEQGAGWWTTAAGQLVAEVLRGQRHG